MAMTPEQQQEFIARQNAALAAGGKASAEAVGYRGYDPFLGSKREGVYAGMFKDYADFLSKVPAAARFGGEDGLRAFGNAPEAVFQGGFNGQLGKASKDAQIQARYGVDVPGMAEAITGAFGPQAKTFRDDPFAVPQQYQGLLGRQQGFGDEARLLAQGARDAGGASREQQLAAMNMLAQRAGGQDSVVALQAQAEKDALARQIASRAASAQGGAYNPAVARAAIYAQSGLGQDMAANIAAKMAQERLDAQKAYYDAASGIRQQDIQRQQLEMAPSVDYEKLGMTGLGMGEESKQAAWDRYMGLLGLQTQADMASKGMAFQSAQQTAANKNALGKTLIGGLMSAGSAGLATGLGGLGGLGKAAAAPVTGIARGAIQSGMEDAMRRGY